MRLGVYTDHIYRQSDGVVSAELGGALFIAELSHCVDELVLFARLDPKPGTWTTTSPTTCTSSASRTMRRPPILARR